MSLLDEARAVRERIAARLRELEPLVKEYNELRQMAAEMGLEAGEAQTSAGAGQQAPPEPPGEGSSSRPPRVQRGGRASARQGVAARAAEARRGGDEIDMGVLEAVRAEPGMTVAEYARALGVSPTTLYRPVRELTNEGKLVKRARQLFPA